MEEEAEDGWWRVGGGGGWEVEDGIGEKWLASGGTCKEWSHTQVGWPGGRVAGWVGVTEGRELQGNWLGEKKARHYGVDNFGDRIQRSQGQVVPDLHNAPCRALVVNAKNREKKTHSSLTFESESEFTRVSVAGGYSACLVYFQLTDYCRFLFFLLAFRNRYPAILRDNFLREFPIFLILILILIHGTNQSCFLLHDDYDSCIFLSHGSLGLLSNSQVWIDFM